MANVPPAAVVPMAGRTWYLFCDEAGNTGARYLDPDQPFYVLGAYLIDAAREAVREVIAGTRTQAVELKASRLVRRPAGREVVATLLRAMGQAGGIPCFVLIDKRYSLAARFVDDYLDSTRNDRVGEEYSFDRERMQWAATWIARLEDSTLGLIPSTRPSREPHDCHRRGGYASPDDGVPHSTLPGPDRPKNRSITTVRTSPITQDDCEGIHRRTIRVCAEPRRHQRAALLPLLAGGIRILCYASAQPARLLLLAARSLGAISALGCSSAAFLAIAAVEDSCIQHHPASPSIG